MQRGVGRSNIGYMYPEVKGHTKCQYRVPRHESAPGCLQIEYRVPLSGVSDRWKVKFPHNKINTNVNAYSVIRMRLDLRPNPVIEGLGLYAPRDTKKVLDTAHCPLSFLF